MNKLPPLKAIQVFEVAARHLSFSRAADELCVSQSAVSHQVKSLESYLGKQLFIRAHNAVFLTSYGEVYFSGIANSFNLMQKTTNALMEMSQVTLKIMAQSSFATEWLAPKIAFFKQQNPEVTIKLSMAIDAEDYDPSEFHISIGTWPTPTDYTSKQIREESWFPVFTEQISHQVDPTNPRSILKIPLFSSQNGNDWNLWARKQNIDLPNDLNILQVNDALLATKAALSGQGVALSCDFIAADMIQSGHLKAAKNFSFNPFWGQYFIHYLSGSAYIDKFVDWVLAMSNTER